MYILNVQYIISIIFPSDVAHLDTINKYVKSRAVFQVSSLNSNVFKEIIVADFELLTHKNPHIFSIDRRNTCRMKLLLLMKYQKSILAHVFVIKDTISKTAKQNIFLSTYYDSISLRYTVVL